MAKQEVILAIESSCDDTSIAIMKGNKLLSNVTSTSMKQHRKYGGIVPELASRSHCSEIDKVCTLALKEAKLTLQDLDYVAYTAEPGLVGSLHVGKVFANMLATLLNIPVIKINHMMGHAFSYFVDHDIKQLKFPVLSLVVSGGHTFIARATSPNNFKYLNESIDDAAGEALDKIGRFLGLPYPGGISIDNIYSNKKLIELAPNKPVDAPFTFSGIKTAALNMINTYKMKKQIVPVKVIASSSLEWITNDLVRKLEHYLSKYKDTKMVLVGGGVSANKLLRKKLSQIKKVKVLYPTLQYTNDNAAMIAAYARIKNK
ncbi:MAG: tRNA (adenosine(37)-N6)-threonylcarbamoyltransferase complex transferase subunit TsaD [Mycoplasmoidaceae bacterium]